jgi:hypothetical protein
VQSIVNEMFIANSRAPKLGACIGRFNHGN